MAESPLLVTHEGAVTTLCFNRPERLNAIDVPMATALVEALTAITAETRCLVLAGAGRAFMAGGDVSAFHAAGSDAPAAVRAILEPMHQAVRLMAALPCPVLASVQGAAAGAGLSLALGADLVIAAEDARFTLAYTRIATVPDCGGTWHLPRALGLRRALGMALLQDSLDAQAALAAGLVNRVVPAAERAAQTAAIAAAIATGPAQSYAATKRLLRQAEAQPLQAQLDAEEAGFLSCAATADFREGVAAFIERRKPRFG